MKLGEKMSKRSGEFAKPGENHEIDKTLVNVVRKMKETCLALSGLCEKRLLQSMPRIFRSKSLFSPLFLTAKQSQSVLNGNINDDIENDLYLSI